MLCLPCESSSFLIDITLPIESGEDTPDESLSISSVSGLNISKDRRRGTGLEGGESDLPDMVIDLLTKGN